MSGWLRDAEVLEGQGSGETTPCSPRLSSLLPGRGRGSVPSPISREPAEPAAAAAAAVATAGPVGQDSMDKAKELFELCDKEKKGFITKRDMQRLQGELPLSPEQLESVFESLDRDRNGFLTPLEFHTGLGELVGAEVCMESSSVGEEKEEKENPTEVRFRQMLGELGADKLFKDQWELCALWCELQRDRPELLGVLEDVLSQAVSQLQDSLKERDNLEETLRRREDDHDREVRSIYEDMEAQMREEREKRLAEDSVRQDDKRGQLLEELRMREQELEFTLTKQRELESRIESLSSEQAETRVQNHRLQTVNMQLQEQLEQNREELQRAQSQLQLLQTQLSQQHQGKERDVLKVSRNMQKEKDSLMRQLDLLRDMNKRLRDEKDAQQSQKMTPNVKRPLVKRGSVIGEYMTPESTASRRLTYTSRLRKDPKDDDVIRESPMTTLPSANENKEQNTGQAEHSEVSESCEVPDGSKPQTQPSLTSPQRVFKLVFLGSSGVGKSSFIHQYCRGHFPNNLSTTVGMDYQVRSVVVGNTPIALQLWDTAGQERFHSIAKQYYRKADGILAMYDVTDSASFKAVRSCLDQAQDVTAEGVCLMLLGNKTEVAEEERRVTITEGQKLAQEYQAEFYECSAKSGRNVDKAMTHLARLLAAQQDRQCESALHLQNDSNSRRRCCK